MPGSILPLPRGRKRWLIWLLHWPLHRSYSSVLFKCSFTCWSAFKIQVKSRLTETFHPFKLQAFTSHCQEVCSAFKRETAIHFDAGHNELQASLSMEEEGETDLPPSFLPLFPKQGNGLLSSYLHPGWLLVMGNCPSSMAWEEPNLIRVDVGFNLL